MMKKCVVFAAAVSMCSMMMVSSVLGATVDKAKEKVKIQIKTEYLHDVISVNSVNDGAKKFLSGYKIKEDTLDDVVEELADKLIADGYLGKKYGNNIRITVKDSKVTEAKREQVNKAIADYLDERHLDARIAADKVTVEEQLKRKAAEYKISAGKMYIIHEIRIKNSRLSEKEMAAMDMDDLMRMAKENGVSFDAMEDVYDDFDDDWYDDERYDDDDRYDRDDDDDDRDDDDDDRYDDDDRHDRDDDDDDDDDRHDHDDDDDRDDD